MMVTGHQQRVLSIVEDKYVHDKAMLSDDSKEGMVTWPEKNGKDCPLPAYKARVIFVDAKYSCVKAREVQEVKKMEPILTPKGRAQRAKKELGSDYEDPLVMPSFSNSKEKTASSKREVTKKKHAGSNLQMENILKKVNGVYQVHTTSSSSVHKLRRSPRKRPRVELSSTDSEDEDPVKFRSRDQMVSQINFLKKKAKQDAATVKRLTELNLYLQEGLPVALARLTDRAEECLQLPAVIHEVPATKERKGTPMTSANPDKVVPPVQDIDGVQPMLVEKPVADEDLANPQPEDDQNVAPVVKNPGEAPILNVNEAQVVENPDEAPNADEGPVVENPGEPNEGGAPNIDLLPEAFSLLNEASTVSVRRAKTPGKVASLLMSALFTPEEMVPGNGKTMTVTGKDGKPALDQQRVKLVHRHVMKYFSKDNKGKPVNAYYVNAKMAQKLKYEKNDSVKKNKDSDSDEN